ncbi:hypothetical protein B0H11DRAFT_1759292 [Mycena galericulata]|nr:hypothetical protein B0H11DRAFT_1759292 [Mycena galericulata]
MPSEASDAGKENAQVDHDALKIAKERGDGYQKKLYNGLKRLKRSHKANADQAAVLAETRLENGQLRAEVTQLTSEVADLQAESSTLRAEVQSQKSARSQASKKFHAQAERIRRFPSRVNTAVSKATAKAQEELSNLFSFNLKENGVIPDSTRDMINDLVALDGVRPNKVIGVLKRIAGKLGIGVTGDASDRSVRRIVKEGGVASGMQFIEAVGTSKGVTLSSDGTTHKNVNLESRRATVIDQNNQKQTFFLGIGMAINHTSEKQLEGWEELIEDLYQIYKTSSRCETADDARDFWLKVTGWHSDHAEDQKKLFRLARAMKLRLERERRGERTIAQMAPEQWAEVLFKISHDAVTAAGGIAAWEKLGDEERLSRHDEAFTAFVRAIGEAEFEKLTLEEKENVDLFIWGGCCMHKHLNVFKGSVFAMQKWWGDNNLPGPLKMYNRDNAAAVSLGEGTGAATRAEDRTIGGAIKVSSLAGAIFRHKDRKRGQQDTLRYFWDHETGFNICFPDTSNTRFQSHAGACEIIVVYMELILQFLVYVRENKGNRALNHMELNVERGLLCWYTRHEFVVIALLHQNVDVKYMLEVRGPLRKQDNLLKLGDLHKKVKVHLQKIIDDPKLVSAADASFSTATLDGRPWEKPEVVYAALARISEWKLTYVDELIVAYCKGALETWARFDTEWSEEGPISKLTPENIERAWLEVTNDGNESELGILRQSARSAPNISLPYHSALRMYKANNTSDFMKTLTAPDRQSIRAQVRKTDASGANRKNKHAQIVHMKQVVDKNTARDTIRKDRVTKAQDAIAKTTAIDSVEALDAAFGIPRGAEGYLGVAALDLQLDWHLANPVQNSAASIPKAKSGAKGRGTRETRYTYLKDAISKRSESLQSAPVGPSSAAEELQAKESQADAVPPEQTMSSSMDVDDDTYDSEEEWYGRS